MDLQNFCSKISYLTNTFKIRKYKIKVKVGIYEFLISDSEERYQEFTILIFPKILDKISGTKNKN